MPKWILRAPGRGVVWPMKIADGGVQKVTLGRDHVLEIASPEPLVRGTALAIAIEGIDL
jgi:hypothetical protein